MIEIVNERPQNGEHLARLLAFYGEIAPIFQTLQLTPLLTGSLAVFAYTRSPLLWVNDIDLACSESAFPRLGRALAARGMETTARAWHVLQVRRDDLKIEFDAIEHWFAGVPTDYDTLIIAGHSFHIVGLSSLRELYRRGLEGTAGQHDAASQSKYAAIAEKYALLRAV